MEKNSPKSKKQRLQEIESSESEESTNDNFNDENSFKTIPKNQQKATPIPSYPPVPIMKSPLPSTSSQIENKLSNGSNTTHNEQIFRSIRCITQKPFC